MGVSMVDGADSEGEGDANELEQSFPQQRKVTRQSVLLSNLLLQ